MQIRVRFAPSPTGRVHLGNMRTAIFNWLFARHHGGRFLLRIEDTDRQRSHQGAIDQLLAEMTWLDLDFDGDPLYQHTRSDAHRAAADRLMQAGHAYAYANGDGDAAVLFRIPLDPGPEYSIVERERISVDIHPDVPVTISSAGITYAAISRKGKPIPSECCLAGMMRLKIVGDNGVVRYDLGKDPGAVTDGQPPVTVDNGTTLSFIRRDVRFHDLVRGDLSKPLDSIKDFVIVRSDGHPVFHLANVCDDIHQQITHVIRGDDHIENSYRHVLLFAALGHAAPAFLHLPMIVNREGKPYSKRDGDAYIGELREAGFMNSTVFNYLALLGWSPGDDREKMSRADIVNAFDVSGIQLSAAQMDIRKLQHMNGQYIADLPFDAFLHGVEQALAEQPWARNADPAYFREVAELMQSRTKQFTDAATWQYFFVDTLSYDDRLVGKHIGKPGIRSAFAQLLTALREIAFDPEPIESAIHAVTDDREIPRGKFNLPLRIAVTASNTGAGIYEVMALLGRDRTLARLTHAVDSLCADDSEQ